MREDAPKLALACLLVATALIVPLASTGVAAAPSGNNTTTTTPETPTGPHGYTLAELRSIGTKVSQRESIRRFGDGQLWMRYQTGGLLSTLQYLTPSSTVTDNQVRLGGFVGWDRAKIPDTITVHVVAYDAATVNGTRVPSNVVERDVRVSLSTGYIGPNDRGTTIPVPVEHGDSKFVTMWVEGHREATQWTFRAAPSVASATVPSTTLAGRVGWATFHIGLAFLITSILVIGSGAVAVKKLGILPRVGILGWLIVGSALIFWIPLFWFQDLANAFAQRPELIGVVLGLVVGLVGIRFLDDGLDKALFVQPRLTEDALEDDADGRKWWWANRVHKVTTRERDGKMLIPRTGWLGSLARLWPGYDAAPLVEFDGRRHKYAKPDDLDDAGHEPTPDGGYLESIRTRIGGLSDDDEFDHIFIVDPTADDVVVHESEGFEVSMPDDLVTWPAEGEGVRIGDVPIPHVALGKVVAGSAVVLAAGLFVSWLTTIDVLGMLAGLGVLTLFFVRPTDGWANVVLAPGHGGHILDAIWRTADEFTEEADKAYWKNQALEGEARRRVEHANEVDDRKTTMFDETAERLAPDADTGENRGPQVDPDRPRPTPASGEGESDE